MAQNRVTRKPDAEQEPMMGVTVQIEGTTTGTITSLDGDFSLTVPAGDVVLKVSFVGYLTQSVKVPASQTNVTINMQEDAVLLEETGGVGYGTQKKVNLTGSVSGVGEKNLKTVWHIL